MSSRITTQSSSQKKPNMNQAIRKSSSVPLVKNYPLDKTNVFFNQNLDALNNQKISMLNLM